MHSIFNICLSSASVNHKLRAPPRPPKLIDPQHDTRLSTNIRNISTLQYHLHVYYIYGQTGTWYLVSSSRRDDCAVELRLICLPQDPEPSSTPAGPKPFTRLEGVEAIVDITQRFDRETPPSTVS